MARFGVHCSTLTRASHPSIDPAPFDALERALVKKRPALVFDPEGFAQWLCDRLPDAPTLDEALERVRVHDLYLAWACVAGQAPACQAFEDEVMPLVQRALRGIDRDPAFVDDVAAAVRTKLLVAERGDAPGLSQYLGQGPIGSFAMVVAMREAVDRKRTVNAASTIDEVMQGLSDGRTGADVLAQRRELQPHLQRALSEALAAVTPRQRTLLKLHVVQGLSAERLAKMYGTHRATTTRWISDARRAVLAHVSRTMQDALGVGAATFAAMKNDLVDGVDLTLSGLLSNAESEPPHLP